MKAIIFIVWIICQAVAEIKQKECSSEREGGPSQIYKSADVVKGCVTDEECGDIQKLKCLHCNCVCRDVFTEKSESEKCIAGPEIYKTERTSRSLKVFWNHVSANINLYKVSYIKFTSGPYTNCADKVTKVAGEINNAVLDGLQPYTEYTVAVKAFEDDGKALGEWGEAVTVKTSCETEKECPNDAICLNGNCVCKDGYIFDDHSECKPITCEDHPCGSTGICKMDSDSFFCECPGNSFGDGYHCYDTPCYSSPCQNGATCKAKKEKDGEDKEYECDCPLGFTGDDCEVLEIEFPCSERRIVDIPYCEEENDASQTTDTCDETRCKNEGICEPIPTGQYDYRCKCQSGYIGRTCETNIDEQCINKHGTCKLKKDQERQCLEIKCDCFIGYIGEKCEKKIDCNDNSDCRNGGTCASSKQCLCAPGFKGVFCNEREHQSYIHFPRIHFAGKFQADPSTINNYPDNFDTDNFPGKSKGWNPTGSATWRLVDTRITRVCYANKVCTSLETDDALNNKLLEDGNFGASAKMVDFDVYFQSSTQIYGWSMQVKDFFKGDFQRVGFQYMWSKMKVNVHSMAVFGAAYQSVLTNVQFGSRIGASPITQHLKEQLNFSDKKELSIRFNIDMYDSFDTSANFTCARIVGSIGISGHDSPPYFTFGRMLKPNNDPPNFWFSPFVYDYEKKTLLLDLGNSLAITEDGNIVKSIGNLALAYTNIMSDTIGCPDTWNPFGHIYFSDLGNYALTAGIFKIDVGEEDLRKSRIILAQVDDNGGCTNVVLAEDKDGVDIHPFTRWVLRSKPVQSVTVRLFMTVYGEYPEQKSFNINVSCIGCGSASIRELPDDPGVFEFETTTKDPNHARLFIDGQVYFFQYYLEGRTAGSDVDSAIVILVWDEFKVPTQPNWIRHIKPIFQQYANLYPVMKINFLDLSNYYEVVENKYALIKTMSLDEEDPRYMPVTRDLSPGKVQMILKWLMDDHPRYGFSNLGIGEYTLKYLLQTALQLEHSTIPPYLTGYLSIKKGYNTQVKSILKDILIDEMHHLAQVSNILNAIDGNPNLFAPHFVPSYPSYLPGGVHPDIKITVNKLSTLQIRNVYMVLETPSKELEENGLIKAVDKIIKDTLKQVSVSETSTETDACDDVLTLYNDAVKKNEDIRTNHNTIGQLYTAILIVMAKLECDGELKFNGTKHQLEVRGEGGKEVTKVHDFGTAVQAIKNIMEEGEGSSPCNPLDESSGLSHYYKFASIANRRHLKTIKNDSKTEDDGVGADVKSTGLDNECVGENADTFAYIGRSLPFDEDGVWPIVDNPMMSMYKDGTRTQNVAKSFSKTYWKMLEKLQNVFDGNTFLFGDTVAIMKDLLIHGNRLVQTPIEESGDPDIGPNAAPIYPTKLPDP